MGSKGAYLPQWATIEEATSWLEAVTGESWPQARLLESGHFLSLGVWWRPGDSAPPEWMRDVFEGQTQGFWAPITSKSDVAALAVDRTLVFTQTRTPSGRIVNFGHGMVFELSGLRIEGRSLRALIGALKPENAHITSWVIVPPGVSEFAYDRLGEILADASGCPNECLLIEATRGDHFQGIINTRVSGGEVVLHDARTGELIHISDDAGGDGSVIGLHDLKTLLATPFWFGEERFCFGVLAHEDDGGAPVKQADEGEGSNGTEVRWTPEFTAEVQAYRDLHGMTAAARRYEVSTTVIKNKTKPKRSPVEVEANPAFRILTSGFTGRER